MVPVGVRDAVAVGGSVTVRVGVKVEGVTSMRVGAAVTMMAPLLVGVALARLVTCSAIRTGAAGGVSLGLRLGTPNREVGGTVAGGHVGMTYSVGVGDGVIAPHALINAAMQKTDTACHSNRSDLGLMPSILIHSIEKRCMIRVRHIHAEPKGYTMNHRRFGSILVFVGTVAALVGAAADMLGIGTTPGIGYSQITMMVIGVIMISGGTYLLTRRGSTLPHS